MSCASSSSAAPQTQKSRIKDFGTKREKKLLLGVASEKNLTYGSPKSTHLALSSPKELKYEIQSRKIQFFVNTPLALGTLPSVFPKSMSAAETRSKSSALSSRSLPHFIFASQSALHQQHLVRRQRRRKATRYVQRGLTTPSPPVEVLSSG